MLRTFRRIRVYIQHDLREIIIPTSLPNPPDYIKRQRPTWRQILTALKSANKDYTNSWRGDKEATHSSPQSTSSAEGSLREELSETARAAVQRGQGLRPLVYEIYEKRARSYRDAVQQFVEGYKEGYIGDIDSKKDVSTDAEAPKPDSKQ